MNPDNESIRCDKCLVWIDSEYDAYLHLKEYHPIEFRIARDVLEANRSSRITPIGEKAHGILHKNKSN